MLFVLLVGVYETVDKISYHSIQYSMNSVGIGFGAVMLLTGVIQLLAYVTLSTLVPNLDLFVEHIERRNPIFFFTAIAGIGGLLCLSPTLAESKHFQLVTYLVSRFLMSTYCSYIAYAYGLIVLFINESFPDRIKSSGAGLIEAFSMSGPAIAPFIASACNHYHYHPLVVFGGIVLLGNIPLLFTKETRPKND